MKNKDESRVIKKRIVRSLRMRLPAKYQPKIERARKQNERRFEKE